MTFNYHYSDALPLHAANWWYVDKVFHHIQGEQIKNRDDTDDTKKFREYPNIPLTWDELTWHDKRFVEEYLCNRTRVFYRQKIYYDRVEGDNYNEVYEFDLECELLNVANDKIRTY